MNLLIATDELSHFRSRDPIPLICENCGKIFYKPKNNILSALKGHPDFPLRFCSHKCHYENQVSKNWIDIECSECGKTIKKQKSKIKNNKFSFCSKSCSAKFQNKHSTLGGIRKSKSEIYLVKLIRKDFKYLKVIENVRNILPSNLELDIYIPSINLAIEVNGILPYKPIYGIEKLETIKDKDAQKLSDASKVDCRLLIVNTSHIKYWKETKDFLEVEYNKKIKPLIEKLISL